MGMRKTSNERSDYDVIVIGGGHAGCEAAAASLRSGQLTAIPAERKHRDGIHVRMRL